ncbi:glycosyltransferase [Candidatus Shapirobacteria bacterium]|nr:glycosyltransferase [Candidatus Shapirobacteria bacterium]
MPQSKTAILTGNHHTPAIELIHQLETDNDFYWKIIYISKLSSQETHLTKTIIPHRQILFYNLNSGKFDRRQILPTIAGIPLTILAIFYSLYLLLRHQPNVVISFGGYSSLPVIIASWFLRIPSITHEQTLTNSLTTRLSSFFATKIALSFQNPAQIKQLPKNKTIITGNLLRHDIYQNNLPSFLNSKFLNSKFPLIYITGGNQGSHVINLTIKKLLPKLKNYFIIHQLGPLDYTNNIKTDNYIPLEYVSSVDIGWIFKHATIIISRAGANTCQEISVFNIPSILIPLPYSQQNEQYKNALWLKSLQPDRTVIIKQSKLTAKKLLSTIQKLAATNFSHHQKTVDSNHKFINLVHELVK